MTGLQHLIDFVLNEVALCGDQGVYSLFFTKTHFSSPRKRIISLGTLPYFQITVFALALYDQHMIFLISPAPTLCGFNYIHSHWIFHILELFSNMQKLVIAQSYN
jgi:hypothetical protein